MGQRHQFTRKEAQEAAAVRKNMSNLPKLWSKSRKNRKTGRYEYLVGDVWMTRQAVLYHRRKLEREPSVA